MAWIKRNLFFVIGSAIALVLMGFGGYILYTQMAKESEVSGQIDEQFEQLKKLYGRTPFPGDPSTIDNIASAVQQAESVRQYAAKVRPLFGRIPGIPDTNRVSNSDFATELRNTVSELRHSAEQQSVFLPPDYYFTFQSQQKLMIFDPGSLDKLALQLGEIKALCGILFEAKVNSLDGIRRESVSTNDQNMPDYLDRKTVSTPLADISPYEVTFRCFSGELAYVLSHLASSTNGWVIKAVNVESTAGGGDAAAMAQPGVPPPAFVNPIGPMHFTGEGGGHQPYTPPNMQGGAPTRAPVSGKGPQIFLNKSPFRVTLTLDLVKLKAPAK
jgi:hypothetical protein